MYLIAGIVQKGELIAVFFLCSFWVNMYDVNWRTYGTARH
jgi:hypothetical protein